MEEEKNTSKRLTLKNSELLENQRISVAKAAKILGVSQQFVRVAMQQGVLPIGICVKMSGVYTYHICPEKLKRYLGLE